VGELDGLLKITILGTTVVGMTPGAPVVVGVPPECEGTVVGGFVATVVGTAARVGSLIDLKGPLR
jgi:hypothetical protein